jgi:hypothetical protein
MREPTTKWPAKACCRCTRIGPRDGGFTCALRDCPGETTTVRSAAAYAALVAARGGPEPARRRAPDRNVARRALRALQRARRPLSTAEVRERAGLCSMDSTAACLRRLKRRGLVQRAGRAWFNSSMPRLAARASSRLD